MLVYMSIFDLAFMNANNFFFFFFGYRELQDYCFYFGCMTERSIKLLICILITIAQQMAITGLGRSSLSFN